MKTFKINSIEIKNLTDFIAYLDYLYRQQKINFFSTTPKRWLWMLCGLNFLLSYIFEYREQVTSLDEIIKFKIINFFDMFNNLKPPDENIRKKINEYLNHHSFHSIRIFLTNNNDITIDNLLKKYPIFNEQQKIYCDNTIPPRFKFTVYDNFKNLLSQIRPGHPQYQTIINMINTWINKKGFLLFYKRNDSSQLKKFFTDKDVVEYISSKLSNMELINFFNTILECITLFDAKEKEEIVNFVRQSYPLNLIQNGEQKIKQACQEYEENFFTFLRSGDKQQIEKIFNAISGYNIATSNEFFNISISEENITKIEEEDFEFLLETIDRIIIWMNEEVNKTKNEFDFWLDNDKISYYFKFLYLAVNIYFNYIYHKLEVKYEGNNNNTAN